MRAAMLAVLVLCVGCSTLGSGKASQVLKRGRDLQRAGRMDRAIELYRQAVAIDPQDAQAHFALGAGLAVKNPERLSDEVLAEFQKASTLDPKDAGARYGFAVALAGKDRRGEALMRYREAIALEKKLAQPDYYLRDILKARGMGRKAPALTGERQLREWNGAESPAQAAPAVPDELPELSAPEPAAAAPEAVTPEREGPGMLEKLRITGDIDPNNNEAFYTLGMQMKEDGNDQQAIFMLKRFVTLEKSSASPRKELLRKAEDALFKLGADAE